jgi:hypothetical protein|tara:strand:- start:513 stop:992 length:480 start_codon:yes stop_codon:yes gene_type:complete
MKVERIKRKELLNDNVKYEVVISMHIYTDDHEFFYRNYILVEKGDESILLLSTNEKKGEDDSYEIIGNRVRLLNGFQDENIFNNRFRVMPNYAHYEILQITPYFLDLFETHLIKNIEGYAEDCFTKGEKQKLNEFLKKIPLLKEKNKPILEKTIQLELF